MEEEEEEEEVCVCIYIYIYMPDDGYSSTGLTTET